MKDAPSEVHLIIHTSNLLQNGELNRDQPMLGFCTSCYVLVPFPNEKKKKKKHRFTNFNQSKTR